MPAHWPAVRENQRRTFGAWYVRKIRPGPHIAAPCLICRSIRRR